MARLTTFSRFLITLAIVVGAYFAVKKFLPQFGGSSASTETAATAPEVSNSEPETTAAETASSGATSTFSFMPPVPVGGVKKGVVEVGATGFNSFIVSIDGAKNWKLEKSEFGRSLVKEGMSTEEDIRTGLKTYIADMLDQGVSGNNIHFVISSGAKKDGKADKIIAGLKSLKYVVNVMTAEQEGQFGYKVAVPKAYQSKAFMIDIGSGNTKISWTQGGQVRSVEAAGAKYFQNNTPDATVYADIMAKVGQVPAAQRGTCFIIGGVPFELAKQGRKDKERYTVLKSADAYKSESDKQKAGLNIYKAAQKASGTSQFVFDWDANFTIGFLMGLK